jgi:Ca2+-binding EF-hand superfamily protein
MVLSALKSSAADSSRKFSLINALRMNIFVTNHEEHTLMRRFDRNGDGLISMEEFYNTLADVYSN